MFKLLVNSLAKEFYKQHAGLFLVGFYILFGVVEASQLIEFHQALLLMSLSSPLGIMLVSICWLLYCAKVHLYISQKLSLEQYNFIKEIGSREKKFQLKLWLKLYSIFLLPILIYVVLLIILGLKFQLYSSLFIIKLIILTLTFLFAWVGFNSLNFFFLKQENRQVRFNLQIKRPFFSWPIFYLFNEQLVMLLMCKIISAILFKGVLWMFADVGNDIKVLLTALLAAIICHSALVLSLLRFETEQMNFVRSLPIKITKRLWNWLLVFAIILIPEWALFTMAADYNLYAIANGFLFGLSALLFLVTILYMIKLNTETYLKFLLFFFFIALYVILGSYDIVFSILMITCSLIFYLFRFNKTDLREI